MRPVKEGRDAGVYGAEGRDKVADVGVLGPKGRSQLVQNARESELPVLEDETTGQRRADALTSICLDSLTGPNPAGETGRAVTVAEIFIEAAWALSSNGEAGAALSTGVKVGPNTLGEILCGGKVRVTNCAPTHPLSYSDLGDTIPPAVRRYVKWRDQGSCSIEGCTSRYRVQPHPIHEQQHGGDHHLDNLISLCWYHHHVAIHQQGMIIDSDSPTHRRKLLWPNHSPPDSS